MPGQLFTILLEGHGRHCRTAGLSVHLKYPVARYIDRILCDYSRARQEQRYHDNHRFRALDVESHCLPLVSLSQNAPQKSRCPALRQCVTSISFPPRLRSYILTPEGTPMKRTLRRMSLGLASAFL